MRQHRRLQHLNIYLFLPYSVYMYLVLYSSAYVAMYASRDLYDWNLQRALGAMEQLRAYGSEKDDEEDDEEDCRTI